jgi:hypothetical protein
MDGRTLIPALKDVLCPDGRVASDSQLAAALSYVPGRISQLNGKEVTASIVGNIVQRAVRGAARKAQASLAQDWVRTIAEFFPVAATDSKQGARFEILDQNDPRHKPLCLLLRNTKAGLYSFYNSEASIIYLGKTKNNLWSELNNAFNRDMAAHEIWFVRHPQNKSFTRSPRPIRRTNVHLYDTAQFFSAYEVDERFVDKLEAMFIRMLPNNLTNVRIEGQTDRTVERPIVTGGKKNKSHESI